MNDYMLECFVKFVGIRYCKQVDIINERAK